MERSKSVSDKENTVPAVNQLEKKDYVSVRGSKEDGALKIMFVGNSITRHGRNDDIGWPYDHGMAASCPEKDYLHLTMERVHKIHPNAVYCITQGFKWETRFWEDDVLDNYLDARDYAPDIIIYRIGENVLLPTVEEHDYTEALRKFLSFLTEKNSDCKIIFTTNFWIKVPVDNAVITVADEYGRKAIDLGLLGENPEMKAIGLFKHGGVAAHPGDKGMQAIADAIWEELKELM
ncbi:MAG: SGNH/GDSL hydrolase family protein [Bacillota bacterium]|nr:SGNH/GDSL hydrolase family protein [Bacillota bacterium]